MERLMQKYGYYSPGAHDGMLIVEKHFEEQVRTLQQQNAQLIEALETSITWMQGAEMFIKAQQMRKILQSIQGESHDS